MQLKSSAVQTDAENKTISFVLSMDENSCIMDFLRYILRGCVFCSSGAASGMQLSAFISTAHR